ncbi:unnamed protein product, partial [Polarella glacialis]
SNLTSLRVLRIVRITRLIRVVRIVRVLRFIRALRVLVHSILHTMKALIWSMFLLLMIMYVFSILFTDATTIYLADVSPSEASVYDAFLVHQ